MIGNTLLLALVLFMAFGFVLMDRLKFLVPYGEAIFRAARTVQVRQASFVAEETLRMSTCLIYKENIASKFGSQSTEMG